MFLQTLNLATYYAIGYNSQTHHVFSILGFFSQYTVHSTLFTLTRHLLHYTQDILLHSTAFQLVLHN